MTDLFRAIGNLLEMTFLAVESAYFDVERFWRGFKKFVAISIFSPVFLFILAYIFHSSILIIISGIILAISLALILLPFTALVSVIGMVRRKSEGLASKYLKFVSAVILWELLIVFYCTILPIWQNPKGVLVAGVGAVIIALAGVVWGAGYITWFRKVAIFFVAVIFIFQTLTLIFPQTTGLVRERLIKSIDKKMAEWIIKERIPDELKVADINRDDVVDTLDIVYLDKFLKDPNVLPDSSRGDVNGDGKIDIEDIKYLENYLYHKGPPPVFPSKNRLIQSGATKEQANITLFVSARHPFPVGLMTPRGYLSLSVNDEDKHRAQGAWSDNSGEYVVSISYQPDGTIHLKAKGNIVWINYRGLRKECNADGTPRNELPVNDPRFDFAPQNYICPEANPGALVGELNGRRFLIGKSKVISLSEHKNQNIQRKENSLTVNISANRQLTYVAQLKKDQQFRIEAWGTWDCSGGAAPQPDLPCGPDGLEAPSWVTDKELSMNPLPMIRRMHNLIGQFNNNKPFAVGSRYEGIAPEDGILYVGPNDFIVKDNDGYLTVKLTIY